ncbi:MAG: glutaredoxin family protein [Spirochaetales bacterium]|nr:glutaredoxin family protein [Spirochaetales bacterium]
MTADLYTTPSCGYCRQAKDYLRKLGINVKEIDITRDERSMQEFARRVGSHSGVPVIFLKGVQIKGFDKNKIDNVLCI